LNVISLVPNAVSGNPTYNDVMLANPSVIASYHWGTFTLSHGGSAVINGINCPKGTKDTGDGHVQFVFEFAQPGSGYSEWDLAQYIPDAVGVQLLNGVYMTYNC
jgi:hypothetical protein